MGYEDFLEISKKNRLMFDICVMLLKIELHVTNGRSAILREENEF
jgi:hypothetical protein